MARVTRRKIDRTLREIEKTLTAMGTISPRELEEEREFDELMDIKEEYHRKWGTRNLEYDLDPNEF